MQKKHPTGSLWQCPSASDSASSSSTGAFLTQWALNSCVVLLTWQINWIMCKCVSVHWEKCARFWCLFAAPKISAYVFFSGVETEDFVSCWEVHKRRGKEKADCLLECAWSTTKAYQVWMTFNTVMNLLCQARPGHAMRPEVPVLPAWVLRGQIGQCSRDLSPEEKDKCPVLTILKQNTTNAQMSNVLCAKHCGKSNYQQK